MNIVPAEDMNYLVEQSSDRINMILSGMTALMNDNDEKVELMESQGWFQRMVKTVTGKNKATKEEIQRNHDRINAYMSEAIAELYNQNCIDHQIMISLGHQLNEIYADHIQLKQMLGAFVSKLNEKIESVDNFHMLIEEISQGMYTGTYPIVTVVNVLSMMDKRMLTDKRKCDIVTQAMRNKGILNTEPITLFECFSNVMSMDAKEVGRFYLEVQTIKENYFADMVLRLMDKMYFLTEQEQDFVNKSREIRRLIVEEDYDENSILTTEDIFDEFLIAKQDVVKGFLPISEIQLDTKLKEAEDLFFECKLDEAFELFKALANKGNARAMYFMGEYYLYGLGHVNEDGHEGDLWREKAREEAEELVLLEYEKMLELAEGGDVFAQYELAEMYMYGIHVDESMAEGLKWLNKASDAGFWRAIQCLGDFYFDGNDYIQALVYYQKGAELNCAESEYKLAWCYDRGKGTSEDWGIASKYYKRAIEHGNARAAYYLGVSYIDVNESRAFDYINTSVEMGCTLGRSALADCYATGIGTEQNMQLAKKWYLLVAEEGDDCDYAATELGKIASYEKNYGEAIEWYRKAALNEYADAQNKLGEAYEYGLGVEMDDYEAVKWYQLAAEQEHMEAIVNLARAYYYNMGVDGDETANKWSAFVLLEMAIKQGSEEAKELCGEWFG